MNERVSNQVPHVKRLWEARMADGRKGFGKRLREAMLAKGFVNRRGDPDVTRFALAHGWIPNYVYRWLADETTPDMDNLDRLGEALGIPPAHLLYGDEVNRI